MKTLPISIAATVLLASACAGSYPPPTQEMADVEAANRSANELGAQNNPKAQLHLKLAEEQMKQAKAAMDKDDNRAAKGLLMRAKSDAELAVALMHQDSATMEATKAADQSNVQRSTNSEQGAAQ